MKIAIAGYGIEGQANYEYFRNQPDVDETVIFDAKEKPDRDPPTGVKMILGPDAFNQIAHDFTVVRTAGLSPFKIPKYFRDNEQIISSTIEFFAKCPAPIIGITGSKGKGTVASMITEILRAIGKTVYLIGNIGVPALQQLPKINADDIVVYELSSFQLWDLKQSPHIAVITMIEPDHLDVHENFADYVLAKNNIVKYQTANDIVVYNDDDQLVREMTEKSASIKLPFPNNKFAHIRDGQFWFGNQQICETAVVKVPGEHNLRNALAAINATWDLIDGNVTAVHDGLTKFEGLPHRLKFVREIDGVRYYDDSIATTPGSAVAALKSFDKPKILIVGGQDKGVDYAPLAREVAAQNVRMVFAIGANRAKLAQEIRAASDVTVHELDSHDMNDIVRQINQNTEPGDTVIMSPAAASFDMFKNYQDRGEQFVAAVNML